MEAVRFLFRSFEPDRLSGTDNSHIGVNLRNDMNFLQIFSVTLLNFVVGVGELEAG